MSESVSPPGCDCPPPAERVEERPPDPRAELLRVAARLQGHYSTRLLAEYLRLRRAVR